jgi:hypothetical protein
MFTPKQERNGVDQGVATVQSGAPSADITAKIASLAASAVHLGDYGAAGPPITSAMSVVDWETGIAATDLAGEA